MRRTKEDAEQTRQAILDASERLFCTAGLPATTLEAISQSAGVTRGAFYWHFKDKADVLAALCERHRLPQEELVALAAEQGHEDPLGLLETAGHEMLAAFEADEGQQRLFRILSNHAEESEIAERIERHNRNLFDLICRVASRARQDGTLNTDFTPQEAAVFMLATMNGLLSEWLRSSRSFSLTLVGRKILSAQIGLLRQAPRVAKTSDFTP